MALVHPASFGILSPEHRQIILHSQHVNQENDLTNPKLLEPPILPPGYPLLLDSNLAWSPSEIQINDGHTYHLTQEDKVEIESALSFFKGLDHQSILYRLL
jgi:hypothetical protein